ERSSSPPIKFEIGRSAFGVRRFQVMTAPTNTPAELGYRMPAEWEPHAATWLSWPRREGISFPDSFDRVLPALREMVAALIGNGQSGSDPVCINVINGAHEADARDVLDALPQQ